METKIVKRECSISLEIVYALIEACIKNSGDLMEDDKYSKMINDLFDYVASKFVFNGYDIVDCYEIVKYAVSDQSEQWRNYKKRTVLTALSVDFKIF